MAQPIAIRSLQCADHAFNIPPTVLSIVWFLGKRCNYDCSYCSPHTHDSISPFVDLPKALKFVEHIDENCTSSSKKLKWGFTGGEPFIDPGFLHLSQHIRKLASTHQLNVVTNGSMPLSIYRQAMDIFDGLTVSLHLERSRQEIQQTLDKLRLLRSDRMLSVNLMFLPGHLAQVQHIVEWLRDQEIAFVVRKISPTDNHVFLPFVESSASRKNRVLLDIDSQVGSKIKSKKHNDFVRSDRWKDLYSMDELDYLETINTDHSWVNCGVWYDDGSYHEHNSDYLLSRGQIQFEGWTCWAGVDCFYIDFDGSIYRGNCLNDGAIGNISQDIGFLDQPTICQRKWCTCNADIAVRKASWSGMQHVAISKS